MKDYPAKKKKKSLQDLQPDHFVCKEGLELKQFLLTDSFAFENMDAQGKIQRIYSLESGIVAGFITTFEDGTQKAVIKE
jgi:hypothetical protein